MSSMNRRGFMQSALAASLAPLLMGAQSGTKRPNILFIFTDDHAQQSISAYGSKINVTPNIDRIAQEGVLFKNNTCCNSICGPSRAAILTGKHSHVNGFRSNLDTFDGNQETFPKLFQQAGYETAMIGKWHLKSDPQGFDHWEVFPGQGHYYNPVLYDAEGENKYEGYATDIVTNLSLRWLEEQRDDEKPFMLMCQHKAPHRTWSPGPDHLTLYDDVEIPEPDTLFDDYENRAAVLKENEMMIGEHLMYAYDLKVQGTGREDALGRDFPFREYKRMTPEQRKAWDAAYDPKNEQFLAENPQGDDLVRWKYQRYIKDYLRCIASVDDNVGRMLDYLDEQGLAENTLVIYSSDQGFYLGEHGMYDKRWMYEESLRMPLVARWPGRIKAGTVVEELTQNIDFAPTFLDAAGVDTPVAMQGESLVPLMAGEAVADWRDAIYYHYYEKGEHNVARHEGVRTAWYKLIHYYDVEQWELFDLEKDPQEMKSVYGDAGYGEVLAMMEQKLVSLKKQYEVKS